jgi:hypothetical protein
MESLMWKDGRRRCGCSVDVWLAGDDEVLDDEVEEVDGEGGVCRRCVYVW